ncbi:imelysin family protein [Nisaea sediminum]|uniref:imelysin family protein n=1 Tax=Nisaea sediminum TaxID=2775867 RepID=UPI001865C4FE|nr:imelysin family protein [Nisaea sediminum]
MKRIVASAAIAFSVSFFPQPEGARAQDAETAYATIAAASVTNHILPRYERLAAAGATLAGEADAYCAAPDAAAFFALDRAFRDFWLSWADIRHIQFGPITYLDRAYRIQFWPDTRGKIGKQLARTLADADSASLSAERFATTSVAIQGLPALERLLAEGHDGYAGAKGAFRCALTRAIARNLATISEELVANWNPNDGYAHMVAVAGTGDGPYNEAYEVPVDLLQSLLGEIEANRDTRLGHPLGSTSETARPKLAEAWRSGLSREILGRSVSGLEDLYLNGGFDAALRTSGEAALADRIKGLFTRIESDVTTIGMPLYDAFEKTEGREKLQAIRTELKELAGLIGTDLAVALDISPGFNSRDGD